MNSSKILTDESILVLIDNAERMFFFCNLIKSNNIKNITFLHSNFYTFIIAQKNPLIANSMLLKREINSTKKNNLSIEEVKNKQPYNYSILSQQSAHIETLSNKSTHIWVFSGFQYSYLAIRSFLDIRKTIFFEIGNFPNKYQSSKVGVNADSDYNLIMEGLRLKYTVQYSEKEYLISKLFNFRPPHVDRKISSKIIESLTNKLGDCFYKTLAPQKKILNQLSFACDIQKSRNLIKKYCFEKFERRSNYALFIGQVEEDTQTVFQSEETCLSALKKAKKISENLNLQLIVRLHPAEKNYQILIDMITYCKLHNIEINNSGSLLSAVVNSKHVITINSTGGLHSILLGKKVTCLGSCFYKDWCAEDVVLYYKYILKNN